MRTPRWLCLLTALVALGGGSGCPGEPPCVTMPTPSTVPPGGRLFAVGQKASIQVLTSVPTSCDGEARPQLPESVTVEIHGPDNEPIPATVELSSATPSATIDFTPPVMGRYHVLVAFAPVGGLQQFSVFAAEDRRNETPLALFLTQHCAHVDRTRNGTWICGPVALRTPDAAPQRLGGTQAGPTVVTGNVVWTVDGSQVLRFEDTGSGPLALTGTAVWSGGGSGGNPSPEVHSRLATENELVLLTGSLLYRYTFTPTGGIGSAQVTPWEETHVPALIDIAGLLLRAGEQLVVVSLVQHPVTFEMRTQVCPYQASTAGYVPVRGEPCQILDGTPVGFEEGVLWMQSFNSSGAAMQTLRRYVASQGRLVEEGSLALEGQLAFSPPLLRPGPALPYLAEFTVSSSLAVAPYWNAAKGMMEVQMLPELPSSHSLYVGERYLWTSDPSRSSVAVYPRVRPSTP